MGTYREYMQFVRAESERDYQERKPELVAYVKEKIDQFMKRKIEEWGVEQSNRKLGILMENLVNQIDLFLSNCSIEQAASMTPEEIYFRATDQDT